MKAWVRFPLGFVFWGVRVVVGGRPHHSPAADSFDYILHAADSRSTSCCIAVYCNCYANACPFSVCIFGLSAILPRHVGASQYAPRTIPKCPPENPLTIPTYAAGSPYPPALLKVKAKSHRTIAGASCRSSRSSWQVLKSCPSTRFNKRPPWELALDLVSGTARDVI